MMMKLSTTILTTVLSVASLMPAAAQEKFPITVTPADRALLQQQSNAFFKVFDQLSSTVTESTVVIKERNQVIAMGTVTEKGVVTKLSEISGRRQPIRMVDSKGNSYEVKIKAIDKDYDLALLENVGRLPELVLEAVESPRVGSFLIAAGAANQALASGVLSVASRNLQESDRGFLGVVMSMNKVADGGVRLDRVEQNTAASRAGLQVGDIILTVDGKRVNNLFEMRNFLQKQKANDVITLSYKRNGEVVAGQKITLGGRSKMPVVSRSRMNRMKRMGGATNTVSEGFPEVLQSDMQIKKQFCGAPVLALNGDFVGVVISRSSRIKTYIIEVAKIKEAFKHVR